MVNYALVFIICFALTLSGILLSKEYSKLELQVAALEAKVEFLTPKVVELDTKIRRLLENQ